jgi:hypothetical protein
MTTSDNALGPLLRFEHQSQPATVKALGSAWEATHMGQHRLLSD